MCCAPKPVGRLPIVLRRVSQKEGDKKRPTPSKAWRYKWRSNRHALWNTKGRNVRSKIRWFTEFCNSHYLSHFAAFFIDARTKRSVVESCNNYIVFTDADCNCIKKRFMVWSWWRANPPRKQQVRKRHGWKKYFSRPRSQAFIFCCVMIPPQVHLRRPCYDFYFL